MPATVLATSSTPGGDDTVPDFASTQEIHALSILADVEQRNGFTTVDAYKAAILAGNDQVRKEAEEYTKGALFSILYGHNGEHPQN